MLYGRRAERTRIGELLRLAGQSRSGVLVLRGDPGVGKSTLLADAREQAGGMLVLEASGVESEAQLPFAVLHQLLRPVLGELDALPGPQASALRGALGLEEVAGDQRFLVSAAVLSLLDEAAANGPVLCLVDDAHWLDEASSGALVFVARRLEAEGVVMLFAAREGEVRRFDAPGLPELWLGGLDADAAGELLDATAGALSPAARDHLIAGTGGNALALLELPSALSAAQLAGHEPLLDPLPVGTRVEQAFLARVERLPADTRTLLLVAAADDEGDVATVLRAAAALGCTPAALDPAEAAGLLQIRGGRLTLRHPLVRSAVYQAAPHSRRAEVHRALAAALDGEESADRRAWHLAAATVEPDEAVVEALEQAAGRARRRSAFAAASKAFERAAALSGDGAARARRLGAAAENAWFAGQVDRARFLLDQAAPLSTDPLQRADMARWRGLVDLTSGVPADALRAFLPAAREVAPLDPGRALYLCNLANLAATYAADVPASIEIGRGRRRVGPCRAAMPGLLRELPVGLGRLAAGDAPEAAEHLRRALDLSDGLDDGALGREPAGLILAGRAALFLGDDEASFRLNGGAVARARADRLARAAGAGAAPAGALRALRRPLAGRRGERREGRELARELGLTDVEAHALGLLALVAASTGKEDRCLELAAQATGLAAARTLSHVVDLSSWALLRLDLALGRAEEAYERARRVSSALFTLWSLLDRVEAAVRAGEPASGRAWLEEVEPWAEAAGAAWARATARHCSALLSDDDAEAERCTGRPWTLHAARPAVRASPHGARARRAPAPLAPPHRRPRLPARRARDVRRPRRGPVGGPGRDGAAGQRSHRPPARPEHHRGPHPAGAADRPARRRGPHQPRGRGAALPQPAHDRLPPAQRVPQAAGRDAHRAGPRRPRRRRRGRIPAEPPVRA